MGLAVKGGDSITVACDGADEEAQRLRSKRCSLRSSN